MKLITYILAITFLFLVGCAKTPHYVHQESTHTNVAPISEANIQKPTMIHEERSRGNLVIKNEEDEIVDASDFINLYHKKNKPKIIIFSNKTLNEEVSFISDKGTMILNGAEGEDKLYEFENIQITKPDSKEASLITAFMTKTDRAFINEYMDKRVNVLDRAYVLRNQEVKFDKQDERKIYSVLEMSALKEHADIFISVQPEFYLTHISLYVKAIDLNDGRTLLNKSYQILNGNTRSIVLTNSGYQVTNMVDISKTVQNIARKTMQDIAKIW